MYRFLFTPRWLAFHLLVIVGVVTMIALGMWQLRRLDERQAFNAAVVERSELAPVPLAELLAEPGFDPSDSEWRRVTLTGSWEADALGQVTVFNRSQNGLAGDNVLAPVSTTDGVVVLVNRGFVPIGASAGDPPSGPVEILGTVRPSQTRTRGGLTDSTETGAPITEIRRVDLDRLAPQYEQAAGTSVAPVYVDLIRSTPEVAATDPAPVPGPELTDGPHLSYAIQWFLFAGCVALGWVLAVRRSLARHRRDVALATAQAGTAVTS
jgi:cytochrome oxidase assembly protein ShyY1